MPPEVSIEQVRRRRLHVQHLAERLPPGSVVEAAHAGLQDTWPRAAITSLHARVEGVGPDDWDDPGLVQLWPRGGATYVVPRADVAVFTIGSSPRDPEARKQLDHLADAVHAALPEGRRDSKAVATELGNLGHPGILRAVAMTGRVHLRWDARTTELLAVDRPTIDPEKARIELARRVVGWMGPTTRQEVQRWVGGATVDIRTT